MPDKTTARVVSGTISIGFATGLSMVSGLGTTMIASRYYPTEAFGAYLLLMVVVAFLSQVSSMGLELSVGKAIASTDERQLQPDFVSTALLLRLASIAVASVLAWFARPWLSTLFGSSLLPEILVFVPLLFFLDSTRMLIKAMLQGFFLFSQSGRIELLTSVFNLVFLVIAIFVFRAGILGLIFAKAGALFLASLLGYLWIPVKRQLLFRREMARELITFGFPLQLNDIINFTFSRVGTVLIGALLGPAEIALFEVARRIPDSLYQLYLPFRSVYFPFISRLFAAGDRKKAEKLLNGSTRLVSFAGVLAAAVALLFARDIIRLLFTEKYLPGEAVFDLYMIRLGIALVGNVLGTSLVAVGEPDKPPIVNLVQVVVTLVGNVVLIPLYGIVGAAVVSLIGPVITNPLNVLFLQRRLHVNIMAYLRPLLVLIGWGALVFLLSPDGLLTRFVLLALFLGLSMLLSVFTKSDLELLVEGSGIATWPLLRRVWPGGSRT